MSDVLPLGYRDVSLLQLITLYRECSCHIRKKILDIQPISCNYTLVKTNNVTINNSNNKFIKLFICCTSTTPKYKIISTSTSFDHNMFHYSMHTHVNVIQAATESINSVTKAHMIRFKLPAFVKLKQYMPKLQGTRQLSVDITTDSTVSF